MESFFNEALSPQHLVFAVFVLVGALELLVVFFIWRYRKAIISKGHETTARVIEVVRGRGSKGGTTYRPVFHYTTHLNEHITKRSMVGSNPPAFREGEEVVVYYNPNNPRQMVVRNDMRIRLVYWIVGGLAIVFLLIGLIGLLPLLLLYF